MQFLARRSYSEVIDGIQSALSPLLESRGYQCRELTYNRTTEDGLTQVINLQVYPRTLPYPDWQDYDARFTINLGIHVPEVMRKYWGQRPGPWIQEYECCIRCRLGRASGDNLDLWWPLLYRGIDIKDVLRRFNNGGFRFLDRYATRDKILKRWVGPEATNEGFTKPELARAIILAERGDRDSARKILTEYVKKDIMPEHEDFVRKLSKKLGIWRLEA